jgi:hypothetical protein
VGKTTVAAALARDAELAGLFPDGVLWASLGESAASFRQLAAWAQELGLPPRATAAPVDELSRAVAAALASRRMLLVVDDVWDAAEAAPFLVGGRGCATLLTTRSPEVARAVSATPDDVYLLEILTEAAALELLRRLAPEVAERHPAECRELVRQIERLPLALQVAGRLLQEEAATGFEISELLETLADPGRLLDEWAPVDRIGADGARSTVAALLRKSTDRLDPSTRECFAYLGAFAPKPATFDVLDLSVVWEQDDPRPTIRILVRRGLLEPVGGARFHVHALLAAHAEALLAEIP